MSRQDAALVVLGGGMRNFLLGALFGSLATSLFIVGMVAADQILEGR